MSKAALAERADEAEAVDQTSPTPPMLLDPKRIKIDTAGFCTTSWFARMPIGVLPEDLREPSIWAAFMSSAEKTFKKFDSIVCVAYDETWRVDAIVADARATGAVLTQFKVTALPARLDPLPESDFARVAWSGDGYAVLRKVDSVKLSRSFASIAEAARELNLLTPSRREAQPTGRLQ